MNITIDCECNSFGGELLSLALVDEDYKFLYLTINANYIKEDIDPWVCDHVVPYVDKLPNQYNGEVVFNVSPQEVPHLISSYLLDYEEGVNIVADWPEDLMWLMSSVITGPGLRVEYPKMTTELHSELEGLSKEVPHNALYDAIELMNQYRWFTRDQK